MSTIQTTMQLVDHVTPVLNTISRALAKTTANFQALQRVANMGIAIGNVQNTVQDFSNIAASIYTTEQLFEQARTTMETPIQPTIVPPTIPPMPVINPTVPSTQNGSNPASSPIPVPTMPQNTPIPTVPQNIPAPTWQGSNNMEIFNTSGLERFNQELASAQTMANRLASTQASIAINSANTRLFPPNMGSDMDAAYRRVLRISQEIDRLSHQRVGAVDASRLNNTIETLRSHLNSAVTEQNALNSAIQSMDLNSANAAYQRLVNHIDSAEVHIRDNINSQNSFNQSINQGANNASNLMNKIKGMVGAYLGLAGAKTLISNTTGAAMDLSRQMQTLNTMFGNEAVGTTYFKQLQQYALDTGQNISDLTAATRRYIGYTKNTDKLMEFNKIAQKMAVYDPVQGVQGAAYALNEALSGSYTSLKLRFELSNADIKPLKEAVKSGNIDEVQAAMNAILEAKRVTDEVLEAFQNTAASKFGKLVNTFKDKMAEAGQASLQVVEPMIDRISAWLTSTGGADMINSIANASFALMNVLDIVITQAMEFSSFVNDNWSSISPIIYTLVGAFTAYNAILLLTKGTLMAVAVAQGVKKAVDFAATIVTGGLTAAQWALNGALYANPITWVVGAIILFIAVMSAAIISVAKFRGENVSAVGVVTGVFFMLGAYIQNIIAVLYNKWAVFAEFFVNIWSNRIYTVKKLFVNLANNVLDIVNNIAQAIDAVFGSNLSGAVTSLQGRMTNWLGEMPEGYKVIQRMEMKSYAEAYQNGYDWVTSLGDKFKMPVNNADDENKANLDDWNKLQADTLAPIEENTKGTKHNTDGLKDELEDSLEYLRDLAERDVINRFTTAEIRIDMNNSNTINSELDLDGVVESLTDKLYEQMQVVAEGAYI